MSDEKESDLIRIYTAADPLEAEMIKSFLEEQGVFTFIQGLHHRSLLGMVGTFIELHILVPGVQAEQARGLIQDFMNHQSA